MCGRTVAEFQTVQYHAVIDDRLEKRTMIRQVNINAEPFRALGETNSSGIERNVTKDIVGQRYQSNRARYG